MRRPPPCLLINALPIESSHQFTAGGERLLQGGKSQTLSYAFWPHAARGRKMACTSAIDPLESLMSDSFESIKS
jgi:hypothetical protein